MPTKYSATQAALQSAIAPDSPAVSVQASEVSGLDNLARFVARIEADPGVRKVLVEEGLA